MQQVRREFGELTAQLSPSNKFALAHLALQMFAICASVSLVLMSASPFLSAIGVISLAFLLARNLEIAHALIHENFFDRAPKWLNRWLGVVLVSPFLMSWSQWRWTHGLHHRRPDIEGFDYPDLRGITGPARMANHHLMLPHWFNTLARTVFTFSSQRKLGESLTRSVKGFETPTQHVLACVALEYVIVSAAYLVFLALVFSAYSWVGVIGVVLIQVLAGFAHTLIELPEHLLVDIGSKNPLENSYEIVGSPIADFLTFYNTRHASHHMNPNVPIYRLKFLSDSFKSWKSNTCSSYSVFWARFFSDCLVSRVRYRI